MDKKWISIVGSVLCAVVGLLLCLTVDADGYPHISYYYATKFTG